MKTAPLLALTLTASAAIGSNAVAQHADGLLAVDPSGNLVTGQYDFEDGTVLNVETQIYEGEFEGPFSGVWTTDEPGFNALAGNTGLPAGYTTLPGSTSVTFDANAITIGTDTANLWHWDGTGAVSFSAVAAPTVLEISKSPTAVFSTILDGSASGVAGFEIETTSADGFLHKHLDFSVYNTDDSAPATGFYLWSLTINAGPGLQTNPLYFVHGLGIDNEDAHEAAIAYVQSDVVPEPGSALALLAGAGLLAARRRR
ncbi:MAG: PEP-CTERM sorting domain-containing protein [Planctomycetota bacterium]